MECGSAAKSVRFVQHVENQNDIVSLCLRTAFPSLIRLYRIAFVVKVVAAHLFTRF